MTLPDPATAARGGAVRKAVGRLQARYESRPIATSLAVFAVLAAVRLTGAYVPTILVLALLLTPAVLLVGSREVLHDAGLRAIRSWSGTAQGCSLVVLSYAVTVGACVLVLGTGHDNWASSLLVVFDGLVPSSVPSSGLLIGVMAVLSLGVVVPLAEEVCYRGVLLHAVSQRYGTTTGVVVTSAGWALVHLGDYGLNPFDLAVILGVLPSVFVMGLALGWCRLRAGSVLASALAQGLANLLLAAWVLRW